MFEQGNYNEGLSGEFGELRAYLLANLLGNPEFDVESGTESFLNAYYGGGAPYVRQYLDLHPGQGTGCSFQSGHQRRRSLNDLISDEELTMLDRLWADAYRAAREGGNVPDGISPPCAPPMWSAAGCATAGSSWTPNGVNSPILPALMPSATSFTVTATASASPARPKARTCRGLRRSNPSPYRAMHSECLGGIV